MTILVTGAAGFIGSVVARMLLEEGREVAGIDNLNDAYDPRMKHHRLEVLRAFARRARRAPTTRGPQRGRTTAAARTTAAPRAPVAPSRRLGAPACFRFLEADIAERGRWRRPGPNWGLRGRHQPAARAGCAERREPWVYVDTNITGTLIAGVVSSRGDTKVHPCLHLQPVWFAQSVPYAGTRYQPSPLPLRRQQEGRRSPLPHLPLPPRSGRDRLPLLHRVRAGGAPGYERLPLRAVDQRGAAGAGVWGRIAVAGLHVRGGYRAGDHRRPATPGLRGDQPGRR